MTTFDWDANGNLIQANYYTDAIYYDYSRYLYWNEAGSLQAVVDPRFYSYYGYDCLVLKQVDVSSKQLPHNARYSQKKSYLCIVNRPNHTYCQATPDATHSGTFVGFVFTGKERDEETGYGYFGARYYDADLLTSFISIDRYAAKYPNLSPYHYCAWNPIKLTDPTGDTIVFSGSFEEQTKLMGLMAQYKKKNPNQYEKLNKSKNIYNIQYTNNQDDGSGGNFSFNPESGNFDVNIQTDRRRDYSDIEVLTHEMTHANQYEDGELGFWVKYDRNDPTKAILVVPIAHDITDEIEAAKQADKMILVPEGELRIELRTRTKHSELSPDRTNVSQYLLDTWGIDINQPDTYNNALQRAIHNVTVK